jgi:hypothetical protein
MQIVLPALQERNNTFVDPMVFQHLFFVYNYHAVRKHSGIDRETPVQRLFKHEPHLDASIKFIPPLILDNIAIQLGD